MTTPNGGYGREADDPAQQWPQVPPPDPRAHGYPQQGYPEYPAAGSAGPPGPPMPPGQPYGPYPQPMPWPPPRPTNGMAVASLVLGILWIYWIGSILALIFGYIARNQIRERGESGNGMAIAGIVLGWVGVGLGIVVAIILVVSASVSTSYTYY